MIKWRALWGARWGGEKKKKSWHSNTRSASMGAFFYYDETLWWYVSLLTGIWGFSSNPAPAVFLQKLCFHRWRGLHTVVSECAHAHRGGEVRTPIRYTWNTWTNVFVALQINCVVWFKELLMSDFSYRLSSEIEAPGLTPTVIITQCPE